jgi:hypothetical protein
VPVNPLAAAALVAVCFAIPFGVAALFDSGPERTPVAVSEPAVQRLDESGETVRIATLAPAPRLPALREPPAAAAPASAPAPAETDADAAAPRSGTQAPAPAPAPAPSTGGDGGGSSGGGGSDSDTGSGSFDSTR